MKKSIIGILTIASIVFGCGKKPEPQTVAEQTPPPSAAKQTPSTADPRPQAKPAAKSAPTADVSKQTKAIGMMWPLAKQLANKDMLDSYVADVLQRAPNLPQIAADSDLRILANADNSPLPDSDMPVAYCLFEKDNFTNGTKISAKSLSQEIKAALTQGCKVAGNADPTVLADDREPSLFMPKCRDNKKTLEDCSAVGWAVFVEAGSKDGQGFFARSTSFSADFVLVEPGTPLQKWIASAKYRTSVTSSAVEKVAASRTAYTGTWKDEERTVKIAADGTFKLSVNNQNASGCYTVAHWPEVDGDLITLVGDGGDQLDYGWLDSRSGNLRLQRLAGGRYGNGLKKEN